MLRFFLIIQKVDISTNTEQQVDNRIGGELSGREHDFSMPTWTVEQERELLLMADELNEMCESFEPGDSVFVPASIFGEWRDRIISVLDAGGPHEISGNVRE